MFNALKNKHLEEPTTMQISEVDGFGTMAFVAATYTTGPNKLLLYEVSGNAWTPHSVIDLPSSGTTQFADMEIRADNLFLYIGLPNSNEIVAIDFANNFNDIHIPATSPVDIALVPYDPSKGGASRFKALINQIPVEAFSDPADWELLLTLAAEILNEIEGGDILITAADVMEFREAIQLKISDPVFKGFMIDAVDDVLMVLVVRYTDINNPVTYPEILKVIIDGLQFGSFNAIGTQNQVANLTDVLKQKMTTDKFYQLSDRTDDIEQLIGEHLADQNIQPIINYIISGIRDVIESINQVFENASSTNENIYNTVNTLDDEAFTSNGARSTILVKSEQLDNMLDDLKLLQSFTKLTQLEGSIDQKVADDAARNVLLQQIGAIRTLLEGL